MLASHSDKMVNVVATLSVPHKANMSCSSMYVLKAVMVCRHFSQKGCLQMQQQIPAQ